MPVNDNHWVPIGTTARFWTWALVGFATWAIAASWLIRLGCHQITWQGDLPMAGACYSDIPFLYSARGMAEGNFPYMSPDALLEYPVLQTVIASLTGVFTHGVGGELSVHAAQSIYFDVNVAVLLAVWIVTVLIMSRLVVHPRYAVAVALAPAVAATAAINWDLFPVLTVVAAIWFFRRESWVMGGVMLGLGTALKLWPFLLLGGLIVVGIRTRHYRPMIVTGLAAAGTWVAVNLPFYLLDPQQWSFFWSFSSDRGAGYSSVYHVWNMALAPRLGAPELSAEAINMLAYGGFALCCLAILGIGLLARRTPSIEQLSLLIVAAFVLTNKVYSPQFVLWLVPLVILARPKIAQFLVWQVIEVFHWIAIFNWLHYANPESGVAELWTAIYAVAVILHVIAVVAICAATVMDILRGRAPQDLVQPGATVSADKTKAQRAGSSVRQEGVTHG